MAKVTDLLLQNHIEALGVKMVDAERALDGDQDALRRVIGQVQLHVIDLARTQGRESGRHEIVEAWAAFREMVEGQP